MHLEAIFGEFQQVFANSDVRDVTLILAGFFSDNTPGLVRLSRREERQGAIEHSYGDISVWRPRPGERSYVVTGATEYVPIVCDAIEQSKPPGHSFHAFGSVMWDIIKHQGNSTAGVGGGLAMGFAKASDELFAWPRIEIDGNVFVRGFRYAVNPSDPRIRFQYDPSLFASLETAHAATPCTATCAPDLTMQSYRQVHSGNAAFTASGDQRLLSLNPDDSWLLGALDGLSASCQAPP